MASYIAMDLLDEYRTKGHDGKNRNKLHVGGLVGLHGDTHLVIIRFPHNWVLKFITRVFLLAFVVISLPWFASMIGEFASKFQGISNALDAELAIDPVNFPLIFRDLRNEGLLRMGDRALFVSNGFEDEEAIYNYQVLHEADRNMDVISYSDSGRKGMIPDETFDFIFVHGGHADAEFIDRVLKASGIVVVHLGNNLKVSFQKPLNYKIVYVRQLDSTIVAMRKTSCIDDNKSTSSSSSTNSPTQRRLLGLTPEAKKAALKKLEDVLLEPPRASSGKSKRYLKKTRYLPDLMGDSLESYPRRVFINVAGDAGWFAKHYPTRNKNFEIYEVETVPETAATTSAANKKEEEEVQQQQQVAQVPHEMSDWLRKTVKEEEYVVMKAEAEVVEEMVRSKTINLVDELFLECKHQGIKGKKSSRRPYWECLALYGILRDEGVAVHQWWG